MTKLFPFLLSLEHEVRNPMSNGWLSKRLRTEKRDEKCQDERKSGKTFIISSCLE